MTDKGPVRILHIVGRMMYAGTETWLMQVLRHIDRERFHIDFLVYTTEPGDYDDEIRALGSRVIPCLHYRRPLTYAYNFKRILCEQGSYDIVHSHTEHYSGYNLRLAYQAGVPKRIVHSHNDTLQVDKEAGVLRQAYLVTMKHWINQNATIGFAASQKAAEALFGSAWKADPRWHLLYCGVDLKPFRTPVQPLAIRTELGIPTDAIVVGHVGRFWEQKNHTFLIDILVELAKREPKVRLLLVGEGPLRSVIEQRVVQARVADKVIFAGARPDVPQLMLGAMDVFVFPSLYEGLGLVGIEAQAAGLPFVLSDTIPEEISVVPSLIRRLSLSQPAREWAETILSINRKRPSSSQEYALSLIEKTPYNIDYNVKLLESMYAN